MKIKNRYSSFGQVTICTNASSFPLSSNSSDPASLANVLLDGISRISFPETTQYQPYDFSSLPLYGKNADEEKEIKQDLF